MPLGPILLATANSLEEAQKLADKQHLLCSVISPQGEVVTDIDGRFGAKIRMVLETRTRSEETTATQHADAVTEHKSKTFS